MAMEIAKHLVDLLTNSVEALAHHVLVMLSEQGDKVALEVTDDGVGFTINNVDFDANIHFGLKNIRYRLAKMCGADIAVRSEVGVGTCVTVTFWKEGAK